MDLFILSRTLLHILMTLKWQVYCELEVITIFFFPSEVVFKTKKKDQSVQTRSSCMPLKGLRVKSCRGVKSEG